MKGSLLLGSSLGALLVSGCLVHTPIVSSGKSNYIVSSRSSVCRSCPNAATALEAASKFCAKMGKSLVVRNTSGYMDPFGYNSKNQLVFSCRDESSPAPAQTTSANGTIFVDPGID